MNIYISFKSRGTLSVLILLYNHIFDFHIYIYMYVYVYRFRVTLKKYANLHWNPFLVCQCCLPVLQPWLPIKVYCSGTRRALGTWKTALVAGRTLMSAWSAAAAAKSLQSCPTLCNPIDGSPPGSAVPGILQARTLEWVAISFSNAWSGKWKWSHSVVSDW